MGHDAERAQDIAADHIGMVKFTGRDDDGYKKVKVEIENLIQKAETRKAEEEAKANRAAPVSNFGT